VDRLNPWGDWDLRVCEQLHRGRLQGDPKDWTALDEVVSGKRKGP
jgi:hypothetical protein